MEKHGNTFAPGNKVRLRVGLQDKVAAARGPGEIVNVDPDTALARVKWAQGEYEIPFDDLEHDR